MQLFGVYGWNLFSNVWMFFPTLKPTFPRFCPRHPLTPPIYTPLPRHLIFITLIKIFFPKYSIIPPKTHTHTHRYIYSHTVNNNTLTNSSSQNYYGSYEEGKRPASVKARHKRSTRRKLSLFWWMESLRQRSLPPHP